MAVHPLTSLALTALLLSVAVVVAQAAASASSDNNHHGIKANNLVVEACKNMSSDLLLKSVHFDEERCVSVLHSNNNSMVAKDHGDLVVVALDILDNCTNTVATKIDDILRGLSVHNKAWRAFKWCSADYGEMVRRLPVCRDFFLDVKPLGKKTPRSEAMDVLICLDGLGEKSRDCAILLANNLDFDKTEEFYDNTRYINLAWGLIVMATDCQDNDANW